MKGGALLKHLLSQAGIQFYDQSGHKHARAGWLQLNCPFCASNKYHLGYRLDRGWFSCWKCGRLQAYKVLRALLPNARAHWESLLRPQAGGSFRPHVECGVRVEYPRGLGPLQAAHKRQLARWGFDPDELEELWELKGTGALSDLPWRIIMPIKYEGRVVSWASRALQGPKDRRFRSATPKQSLVPFNQVLYGGDAVRGNGIIVSEGYRDAWRIGHGLGTSVNGIHGVSPQQLQQILRFARRIVCFDNEPEAQRRARVLADKLSVFPGETFLVCLDAKDPEQASKRELRRLRDLAS